MKYYPINRAHPGPVEDYDYCRLINRLGGPGKLAKGLRELGYGSPPTRLVAKWGERNSIPSQWVPFVFALAVNRGLIDDMRDEVPINEIFVKET